MQEREQAEEAIDRPVESADDATEMRLAPHRTAEADAPADDATGDATTTPPGIAEADAPADDATDDQTTVSQRVAEPARRAIDIIRSGVAGAREPIADRVVQARQGVGRTWNERPGARVRRVRRMGTRPLPFLLDVDPAARSARPVEVGLRTIDIDLISGTAVGGGAQRGGDFLPLKPFRGANWQARWQRLREAQQNMAVLPPIDVDKYADRYWVVDGHNRVALALYTGQVAIDANVVELVPSGGRRTEPIGSLGSTLAASRAVRTAGSGHRASDVLAQEDDVGTVVVGEDPIATDAVGMGGFGPDPAGTDTIGTDTIGTDTIGTDAVGADTVGTDVLGAEVLGTDPADTGPPEDGA